MNENAVKIQEVDGLALYTKNNYACIPVQDFEQLKKAIELLKEKFINSLLSASIMVPQNISFKELNTHFVGDLALKGILIYASKTQNAHQEILTQLNRRFENR